MIDRPFLINAVETALRRNPVTTLLGPRQCGKTTLARQIMDRRSRVHYFDLEDPLILQSLENPSLILSDLKGLVVIDEVQRRPDLLPLLRVLVDRQPLPSRFLILGSASPDLLRPSSESLAGRVEFVDMAGFDLSEIDTSAWRQLWWRGGAPVLFLRNQKRILWHGEKTSFELFSRGTSLNSA